jgi:hypothetical protein
VVNNGQVHKERKSQAANPTTNELEVYMQDNSAIEQN